jgi:Ni,Fe-hydrogenase III small subunit/formate hydrogenlyase subunit 6/NADH:ubiquinone oxidoreductase subunit I
MTDIARRLLTPLRAGVATSGYPEAAPLLQFATRGLPEIDAARCNGEGSAMSRCVRSCPTGAIRPATEMRDATPGISAPGVAAPSVSAGATGAPWIDAGKCIFCTDCVAACPSGAIAMSARVELARTERGQLLEPPLCGGSTEPTADRGFEERVRSQLLGRLGRSLHVRHLDAGSCNGCDWEIAALLNPYHDVQRLGIDFVASPRHADLLLVSGVMTRNLTEAARRTYEAMPEPRLVVAIGACAISGGVFAGSDQSGDGAEAQLPVDVYLPGCPPRPEAIIGALLMAVETRGRARSDEVGT